MEQLPLFVFGTLRRGQCNHHYLEGRYMRRLDARLREFVRIHPLMIVARAGGVVDGELYFLKSDLYDRTLADCDGLEAIPAGQLVGRIYRRNRVQVETDDGIWTAWAYVHRLTPQT